MQMYEAAEVVQVDGEADANKKLAEGWKLLAVLPGLPLGSNNRTSVIYVLGKHKTVSESSIN
jgi:hypothetical protein